MAEAYLATRISPHLARTPAGFLICKDVPITRSGPMAYLASELDLPGGAQKLTVWRSVEETTSQRFLASAEGAIVTDAHPPRFVDAKNFQVFSRGHMQNVRIGPRDRDGNATVIADLFIGDEGLAKKVETGAVRDVSIGYSLDVVQDGKGRWMQKNMKVNHCAVVPKGRAGSTQIADAASLGEVMTTRDEALRWLKKIKRRVTDLGTVEQKTAWNELYTSIRDGADPDLALQDVRTKFSTGAPTMAVDGAPVDTQRAVADDFVRMCADFLGKDVREVSRKRRERELHRALADSTTPSQSLVHICEAYLGADDVHAVERKLRNKD